MIKKVTYIKGQLNCAESIIDSFNKNNNTNIPIALGSGMGSGATVGSLCGAINAAILIIGYLKGRQNHLEINNAKILAHDLVKKFKDEYNSELCVDLINSKTDCSELIEFTYETLETILNNKNRE